MLKVGLPIALALIMFGMGLGLTLADFTRVFKKPKAFLLGASMQVIALPIIAFCVLLVFPMQPAFAAGLMILAACPGGVTSNVLTFISRGDVALSVSLTAIISMIGFITVPLITSFALSHYMGEGAPELPIASTMIGVLVITVVPVVIGMGVRKASASFADKAEKFFGPFSIIIFITVVLAAIFQDRQNVIPYFQQTGLPTLVLNLLMMFVAIMVGRMFLLPKDQRTAISFECGLQNSTLGLTIALTILDQTEISVPIAVYGLVMLITGFLFAMWLRSRSASEATQGA